jgi:hypothetical protein
VQREGQSFESVKELIYPECVPTDPADPAGSPARFEDRVGDNHHHLICRICGRLVDVDCAVGSAPCLTAVDDLGYEIDEAEVAYWGRCPDCLAQARVPSASESPKRRRRNNQPPTPRE